jgi:uncharacterized protein with ParB-like and HNH nuclease domain
MQAQEARLRKLIEGTTQYVVPLFQRPYSWSEKQWKTLWDDVTEQAAHDDARPHFLGSIVTAPAKSVPEGVGKYLLIDGQQRLTTMQILLASLRDTAGANGHDRLCEKVNGKFLVNTYEEEDEQLKVLPTQDDRPAFRNIIRGQKPPASRLSDAYRFFQAKLAPFKDDAERLERLLTAITDRLSLVSITCDEHDNPHLIFESLNAKGEKLTPADLIRNFLLMRVHVNDQNRVFTQHWLPIQQALGDNLTEFVRHYLMKGGKILTAADVYFELKDRLINANAAAAEAFLTDLHRHGMLYARFVDPAREPDPAIAASLSRLQRLESTVAYPLLLRVFDAMDQGRLTRVQVARTLDVLESFLIRRSVCGLPSNQLRRMFPPVFDAAGGACDGFVDQLRSELGGNRCPNDAAFITALTVQPLYATAKKNARLRVILERMEESYGHKEPASLSGAQIEHVMPQTLTPEWELELGPQAREQWARLLHTLGNLTLTGYNADMSNRPYVDKREAFTRSHFELNRYFANAETWTADAIEARGRTLGELATKIWRDLVRSDTPQPGGLRFEPRPVAVRFRNQEEPVTSWKQGALKLIGWFEVASPGLLIELERKQVITSVLSMDASRFARSRGQIGGVYVQMHGSAKTLRTFVKWIAQEAGIGELEYEFVLGGLQRGET